MSRDQNRRRRQTEVDALNDLLVQIAGQAGPAETLRSVATLARDLLDGSEAAICLEAATAGLVSVDGDLSGGSSVVPGTLCISPCGGLYHGLNEAESTCPSRSWTDAAATLCIPIRSGGDTLGELWVARTSGIPFTARDRECLAGLSGVAAMVITGVVTRENERQRAILSERERLARELHDGLAQILGVTHLRLRALGSLAELSAADEIVTEVGELADLLDDAYRDVREAIHDLRESSRTGHAFVDALRAYLEKYSRQCGIETMLEAGVEDDLVLVPRAEVQVVRVIQEALANVRKHSGATRAVVRISEADGMATFVIEDNGCGFDPGALTFPETFGLLTMRERMQLAEGSLLVDAAPGRGTRVVAQVPTLAAVRHRPWSVIGVHG